MNKAVFVLPAFFILGATIGALGYAFEWTDFTIMLISLINGLSAGAVVFYCMTGKDQP